MATAAEEAGDLFGNGQIGAQFAGEFAVWVGFDGAGDVDAFDEAHFVEHQDARVVFVGVFLNFVEWNVNQREFAVEEVFDALK